MPNKIQEVTLGPQGYIFFKLHLFNLAQTYVPILLLPPFEGTSDPSFQHIGTPFTIGYSVPCLVEIGRVVL